MQKKVEENKGIALITLIVAILMMVIISSVIIYNSADSIKIQRLNNMYNDVRILSEQVFLYYSKFNELPVVVESYGQDLDASITQGNEQSKFHVIDINKIDRNIKSNLNFGGDYYNSDYTGTDIYVINIDTHQIFYVEGITVDNKTYYTIPNEDSLYQKISVDETEANPPVLKENFIAIKRAVENTTNKYDKEWYDYSYEYGVSTELTNWARAKVTDQELYMWVPRYAYNTSTKEIVFLKGITDEPIKEKDISSEEWKIPDAFKNEDKENLTGVWISIAEYHEINSVNDLINKVNNLVGKDNIGGDENVTVTGKAATHYNPIIPVGFRTVQTETASWRSNDGTRVNGWNEGLVIEDEEGNQFVWVPVDGKNVKYEYHYEVKSKGSESLEQSLPSGITNEQEQINTYHGFYIGRYEAGKPSSGIVPLSKKDQIPWNYINWTNSQTSAQSMYKFANTNNHVQSLLITDKMWDTTLKWIENAGTNVTTDCRSWGNYRDIEVTEITEYSTDGGANWTNESIKPGNSSSNFAAILKTGNSEYTKRKNIYDLAGNLWEFTNAKYSSSSSNYAVRGGDYFGFGTTCVAAYREGNSDTAGAFQLRF